MSQLFSCLRHFLRSEIYLFTPRVLICEMVMFHKVFGGEARISTLKKLFPLMEDKKSLTSKAERAQIKGKASLLAAVDYYVSMHSNVFISASPGNMHNALVSISTWFHHRSKHSVKFVGSYAAVSALNQRKVAHPVSMLKIQFYNVLIQWSVFDAPLCDMNEKLG